MADLPTSSKDELIPAVAKHFAQQVVDEKDTLVAFALSIKRLSKGGQPSAGAAANGKKPLTRGVPAYRGKVV